jgi:hypothetical protein
MFLSVHVRRLREGRTYQDFETHGGGKPGADIVAQAAANPRP